MSKLTQTAIVEEVMAEVKAGKYEDRGNFCGIKGTHQLEQFYVCPPPGQEASGPVTSPFTGESETFGPPTPLLGKLVAGLREANSTLLNTLYKDTAWHHSLERAWQFVNVQVGGGLHTHAHTLTHYQE